ncbi:MAG: RNA polymerase sigma factor [Acidobacteriota bacterium]
MDEQDLIRLAAEGDLEAFERLVERKRERVFWIACHIVGDRELARDVTQEVFLRLYRVIRRFRSGGRFDAWLHRIATNLSIDLLRHERPHRETVALEEVREGGVASETAQRRDIRRIFVTLSSLLSRKQRLAFVLREIEGLSTGEVAEILKTRESTVRNHVLQARRILQEELRRRYPEYCRRPGRPQEPGGKAP